MIKFILVVQLCYAVAQYCGPPLESNVKFDNFRDCSLAGYKQAYTIINSLPPIKVEETRTLVKIYCIKKEIKEEKELSKPTKLEKDV